MAPHSVQLRTKNAVMLTKYIFPNFLEKNKIIFGIRTISLAFNNKIKTEIHETHYQAVRVEQI